MADTQDTGRSPDGSGSRASHEAVKASSPKASIPNALSLSCDKCGKHWRDVAYPEHDIDILDAFYGAIPEKFGVCLDNWPGEREKTGDHAGAAASVPLSETDLMWLRGIAAAFDAHTKAQARREALRQLTAEDDASAMEARQGRDDETRLDPKDDSAGPQDIAQTGGANHG